MLLAILFGLQVLGNILVCVESIDERGLKDVSSNELAIDKRDYNQAGLLWIYERPSFTVGDYIPDWRCHGNFDIYRRHIGLIDIWESSNHYCKDDGGNDVWCSTKAKYIRGSGNYHNCILKGQAIADPKKWKPARACVLIFSYSKDNKNRYYKGCTNIDEDKPWCAHDVRYKSGRWSFCINIETKWSNWESWSQCSQACGGGKMTRTRKCFQEGKASSKCSGENSGEKTCNSEPCAVNGGWSEWSSYGDCSVTCGSGMKTKTRQCNNPEPKNGGQDCGSINKYNDPCKLDDCPDWLPWTEFSECSKTCGGGKQNRTRKCGGSTCVGPSSDVNDCNTGPCSSSAKFSKMSNNESKKWIIYVVAAIGCVVLVGIVATVVIVHKNKQKDIGFINVFE